MKTTRESNWRIIIMAGGTGGHVFPGLTVAQRLTLQGWDVRWLGTRDRIEAELVPKYGIKIEFIRIRGLRNGGMRIKLMAPFNIFRATKQARCIMQIWRPDVVLGMGGYVAGPGGLAAWSCRIPIVLHEQNSIVGMTNRYLAKIAHRRLQAFSNAFPSSSGGVEVVGNPVRDEIIALSSPEKRLRNRYGPLRVLVIGGSQGAKVLNHTMPWVASHLSGTVTLWHQVGKGALHEVNHIYTILGETNHRVVEFIDDMATAYDWADIVVCRSGALTVSELAVAGLPALFVPLIQKDYHQYWNARRLEERGAAKIIEQSEFTVLRVSHFLSSLDRSTLLSMAKRARAEAIIDATDQMIRVLEEVVMGTH